MVRARLVRPGDGLGRCSLAANGLTRRGLPGQHRSWGLSNVARLETDGGAVYFKAAAYDGPEAFSSHGKPQGILFSNEAALLAGLTGRFPEFLPHLLAYDANASGFWSQTSARCSTTASMWMSGKRRCGCTLVISARM